jgi:nucleotide-binding universal stress UspA family protein
MKILLAVDGSPFTQRAVDSLIAHISWFKDPPTLHLLHVHAPIPSVHARAVVGTEILEGYYKEDSEAALAIAMTALDTAGYRYTASYRVGEVGYEIADYVKEHSIEMIVMGTHGHGDFKRLLMGSTGSKIIAAVDIPVMLIK